MAVYSKEIHQTSQEIDQKRGEALGAIRTEKDNSLKDIGQARADSLTAIDESKKDALKAVREEKELFLKDISSAKTDGLLEMDRRVEQAKDSAELAEKHARDAQTAADQAKLIAMTDDALDPLMVMLVNGELLFGLCTSDGDELCTSEGDELIANKPLCPCV